MADQEPLAIVVLISGSGSNLQALIDRSEQDLPVQIKAVISNKAGVMGLERAEKAGIPTAVLDHKAFPDRESYDTALVELIDPYQPGLVVLAGFMRILTPVFVNRFQGQLLNIHPSLLPKYRGLHTHQRALDAGDSEHGISVHFVTAELDGGPVIAQAQIPVTQEDTADSLAARALTQEHRLYPLVVGWFAQGRVKLNNDQIELDGKKQLKPMQYTMETLPEQL